MRNTKLVTLEEAIHRSGLRDGMTISFHHHFRGGDKVAKIEKQKVTSNADAREILQYYHIGEEVTICYSRLEDGEYVSHEATVVLGAAQSK